MTDDKDYQPDELAELRIKWRNEIIKALDKIQGTAKDRKHLAEGLRTRQFKVCDDWFDNDCYSVALNSCSHKRMV